MAIEAGGKEIVFYVLYFDFVVLSISEVSPISYIELAFEKIAQSLVLLRRK